MMMYKELFRIEIHHQYFSPHSSADLLLSPDEATLRFIRGQRMVIKPFNNGIKVLVPIDENKQVKARLRSEDGLRFEIFPKSSSFDIFTRDTGLAKGEVLHFSNVGLTGTDSKLLSSTGFHDGTHSGYPMVAEVEIQLTNDLFARNAEVPYQIVFQAKSAKWKYYFVADQDNTDLAVEDSGEKLVFTKDEIGEQSTDEIGQSLRSNFPGTSVFLFESTSLIPFTDQALKNIQLLRDGIVVIKHLPNPEIEAAAVKIIKVHR